MFADRASGLELASAVEGRDWLLREARSRAMHHQPNSESAEQDPCPRAAAPTGATPVSFVPWLGLTVYRHRKEAASAARVDRDRKRCYPGHERIPGPSTPP